MRPVWKKFIMYINWMPPVVRQFLWQMIFSLIRIKITGPFHLRSKMSCCIGVKREGEVPGTHSVTYTSAIDAIEIKHTAFNREGFALGAVVAAEWLQSKKGVFNMKDVLSL